MIDKIELQKELDRLLTFEDKLLFLAKMSVSALNRYRNAPTDSKEEAIACEEGTMLRKKIKWLVKEYA